MATSRRRWTPEDGPLAAEVAHVCVNGMIDMKHATQQGRVQELCRIANKLYAARFPGKDRVQKRLNSLFEDAVTKLDHPAERAAASHSLGLMDTTSYERELWRRREAAAQAYSAAGVKAIGRYTYYQQRKYEWAVIVALGHAVEGLEREFDARRHDGVDELPAEPDYVPRKQLYEAINETLADGYNVIGLAGEGGVGKSTLAKNYVLSRIADDGAYIFANFQSDRDLALSVHDEFLRLGLPSDGLSVSTAWLKLRELLTRHDLCPKYVILDNVDSQEQLAPFMPLPPEAKVFITTRDSRVLPKGAKSILVGELTDEEALKAISLRLPDVSPEETKALRQLGGRALAIDIACAVLRESETPDHRRNFAIILDQYTVKALGMASTRLGVPSIEAMYSALIEHLESDKYMALSVRLLELELASHLLRPLREGFVVTDRFIQLFVDDAEDEALGKEVHLGAVYQLKRFHLVYGYTINSSASGCAFSRSLDGTEKLFFHPLTISVLRSLLAAAVIDRIHLIVDSYSAYLGELTEVADKWLTFLGAERDEDQLKLLARDLDALSSLLLMVASNFERLEHPGPYFIDIRNDARRGLQLARSLRIEWGLSAENPPPSDLSDQ